MGRVQGERDRIIMAKILIIEDQLSIRDLLQRNLKLVGHVCKAVEDGEAAGKELESTSYDLVLLDIMLPGMDGYGIYRQIEDTPIIFLTAKSELADKLKGLTMGADDYITKPFEMLELLARVENVLRRTKKQSDYFEVDQVKIDFESHQVFLNDKTVDCTPKEYNLLETLAKNCNIALSRERLLDLVWGYDFEGDTRTVDVHIQKLRKKLNLEDRIKTVYKLGYRLERTL